jgi:hypothetical protein
MTSRVREIAWVPERCMLFDNGESTATETLSATSTSGTPLATRKVTSPLKPVTPGISCRLPTSDSDVRHTRITPSEAFVETMVAHGVTTAFGIMGSAFMDPMDIFAPAGIRLVPVVHERGAAHMAGGYARVSGKHGIVVDQNGPGISNCVTAIAAAFWAHSLVVIVTPETGTPGTGTMGIGLGGFQEANQLPLFEKFTKYQGHINNENRMAEITARCFDRAQSEMGSTQFNIPRDRFDGDIDVKIPEPVVLNRGAGGKKSLDEAAELLATAKFPVLLSGGGDRTGRVGDRTREGNAGCRGGRLPVRYRRWRARRTPAPPARCEPGRSRIAHTSSPPPHQQHDRDLAHRQLGLNEAATKYSASRQVPGTADRRSLVGRLRVNLFRTAG